MKYIIELVAVATPFAYLFGPPMLANVAAFTFWLLWLSALLGGLYLLVKGPRANDDLPPKMWRVLVRVTGVAAIIVLAAYAHYAMAALILPAMALSSMARGELGEG